MNLTTSSVQKLSVSLCLLLLLACGSSNGKGGGDSSISNVSSEDALYRQAQQSLNNGRFDIARSALEVLDSYWAYGAYSDQVLIDLVYVNYRLNSTDKAIEAADRFLRLNPLHTNADYATFMLAYLLYTGDSSFSTKLFNIDPASRDISRAESSIQAMSRFLNDFPDSEYTSLARYRIAGLRNLVARHHIIVGEFNEARKSYIGAAQRATHVLQRIPDSTSQPWALSLLVRTYAAMGDDEAAERARKVLRASYPDTSASDTLPKWKVIRKAQKKEEKARLERMLQAAPSATEGEASAGS